MFNFKLRARAETVIGSVYQFFPDKLALFHALEARHMERVTAINAKLMQSADMQRPFSEFIDRMIETHAAYCERLAETGHQCYNALLLNALRGEESKRQTRYEEIKALLVSYLMPHLQTERLHQKVRKVMICPHCHSSQISKNGHPTHSRRLKFA